MIEITFRLMVLLQGLSFSRRMLLVFITLSINFTHLTWSSIEPNMSLYSTLLLFLSSGIVFLSMKQLKRWLWLSKATKQSLQCRNVSFLYLFLKLSLQSNILVLSWNSNFISCKFSRLSDKYSCGLSSKIWSKINVV